MDIIKENIYIVLVLVSIILYSFWTIQKNYVPINKSEMNEMIVSTLLFIIIFGMFYQTDSSNKNQSNIMFIAFLYLNWYFWTHYLLNSKLGNEACLDKNRYIIGQNNNNLGLGIKIFVGTFLFIILSYFRFIVLGNKINSSSIIQNGLLFGIFYYLSKIYT